MPVPRVYPTALGGEIGTVAGRGGGDEAPGWLVDCLAELSQRNISLTRIESRPRRIGLGHYMFFADLAGGTAQGPVEDAIAGLRGRCQEVRLLGSYRGP